MVPCLPAEERSGASFSLRRNQDFARIRAVIPRAALPRCLF